MAIPQSFWANPIRNLAFARWRIGKRRVPPSYITLHYNGPAVRAFGNPAGERAQLQFDAGYHMRPDVLRADGIQYHIAILSNGEKILLRPLDDRLWHCGNARGNDHSIAIHMPIGGSQAMTSLQAQALNETVNVLRNEYNIHATNLKPHWEWKSTQCPGTSIALFIGAYRSAHTLGKPFQLFSTTANANVRAEPDTRSAIRYVMPVSTIIPVSRIIEDGAPHNGNRAYVELSDGSGYIHLSIVRSR